jgi:flavorubredoxin
VTIRQIKPDILFVGSNHWDRRYFDELIFLPEGTSYNSYLIKGSEKTCLIDAVDPEKENELLSNLKSLDIKTIDYIVSNHSEQDHSGAIVKLLEIYPEAKIVTNSKCKEMLKSLLLISEDKFIVIEDWGKLSLGNKTLQFIIAPWVHWPDTMFEYLIEDKILFTCDFLGSHLATSELYAGRNPQVYFSAKRYYSEIMMPFRTNIKKHLDKIKNLEIEMIAPSHGPIYNHPEFIIEAYKDWTSDNVKNEVVLPYVSMHGSVKVMAEFLIDALIKRGINVKPFNLAKTEIGNVAIAIVDAATIIIGTPTVLTGAHPLAIYAIYLTNLLRPKTRFASLICSYGWGGKVAEQITGMLTNLHIELLEPVITKGFPEQDDFNALNRLADNVMNKHKEAGIII